MLLFLFVMNWNQWDLTKNLMFVLYLYRYLETLCPNAYPMVRHENEHKKKREDVRTQSHYDRNTDDCIPSPRYNSALTKPWFWICSHNSVFAFANKYFDVEAPLSSVVSICSMMTLISISVFACCQATSRSNKRSNKGLFSCVQLNSYNTARQTHSEPITNYIYLFSTFKGLYFTFTALKCYLKYVRYFWFPVWQVYEIFFPKTPHLWGLLQRQVGEPIRREEDLSPPSGWLTVFCIIYCRKKKSFFGSRFVLAGSDLLWPQSYRSPEDWVVLRLSF